MMDRVVIDTNVIFSGLKSNKGKSFQILQKIPDAIFDVEISVPLILEYEAILTNHFNIIGLTKKDIDDFLNYICSIGNQSKIYYLWRPILKDPFDDHVLEVAVASYSNFIITHNIKDFDKAKSFNVYPITPGEYLEKRGLL